MTEIYVDITQYVNNRLNTGIQRVVKEYLARELKQQNSLYCLFYDLTKNTFVQIPTKEMLLFLEDVSSYTLQNTLTIDIFEVKKNKKIFFDIDSVWNAPLKREVLYKQLNYSQKL